MKYILALLVLLFSASTVQAQYVERSRIIDYAPLDNMPIVQQSPNYTVFGATPQAQRGKEFQKWLAASVKIKVSGASGSGTIIYYDSIKNIAYVATCGHLWSRGAMSAEEGERRNITCSVVTWYKNEQKLSHPEEFSAKLIFYSFQRGTDTGMITFQPNWKPKYFPIAKVDYEIKPGSHQHSLGCDAGSEVAHYDVEIIKHDGVDLVTKNNSPRPGRSGGGLMDDKFYIGTCWGTERTDGRGIGLFTPLSAIHSYWGKQKKYAWLLKMQDLQLARKIPIVDRNGKVLNYPKEYMPIPQL